MPKPSKAKIGSAVFTIVGGRNEVLLTVNIPPLKVKRDLLNREIFAVWTPLFNGEYFDSELLSSEYVTDAQGLEIMKRDVYNDSDQIEFSRSFYPVDSMISVSNVSRNKTLTIWNDRPQAGSVHSNSESGGIKLLIDRFITSVDAGGIDTPMQLRKSMCLKVSFTFSMIDQSQTF